MNFPTLSSAGLAASVAPTPGHRPDSPPDQEKEVAGQFEAMLVQHLINGMRQGSFSGKKDFARQTFEQMFDEEIARAVSAQGLGLGDALFAPNASVRPQELVAADDKGE